MPKRISLKQIEANRQNALKSSGPKTPEGRALSKMNALKHGILSTEAVVHGRCIKESDREFKNLHQRFRENLKPIGPLEEMLVDQIVTAHWRLRRALKAESGEIALNVDAGEWQQGNRSLRYLVMRWEAFGDPVDEMQNSAFGNRFMENQLKAVRDSVEKEGELTEAAVKSVKFRGNPFKLTDELEDFRLGLLPIPAEAVEPVQRKEKKEQAMVFLDRKIRHLEWSREECEIHERKEEEARQAAAILPSAETLEKIMRYETKLERQMYRAMSQLERLQRMRQGEAVPAPLSVEMSERE